MTERRMTLAVILGSAVVGGFLGDRVLLAGGNRMGDQLKVYTAILSAIEDHYVDDVKSDQLVAASIQTMLRTLDPHSNFLETKEYSSLQEKQRGSYYGLGITVQAIDGKITVVAPFEGTPAHRLGIRTGDIISKIESEDARGMTIDDAVKRLRGPKGSPVHIQITREGYDQPLEFTVIRDEIALHSVPYYFMASPTVGYVRLNDFIETTACRPQDPPNCRRELETALAGLKGEGATSVILDIRDNPGGLLDQAFSVSNLFLKKGQLVVYTRGRYTRDAANYIAEKESPFSDVPLVVLVSRHSASASEIVAGAIQDHDRGIIVGETTFGKGLVQTVMPLQNVRGYALSLTTGRYYTPSGRSIQRDYGSTAYEDYVAPRDRKPCEEAGGEAKLTDNGRKVYGGDGITPDYCVASEVPAKVLVYLAGHQAFFRFSQRYQASTGPAQIAGAGSRSETSSAKVKVIGRDFQVDDAVLTDFKAFCREAKLKVSDADFDAAKPAISHAVLEEVVREVFGDGEARKRTMAWDPQIQEALQAAPSAAVLLHDPARYIAEHRSESRVATGPSSR
jgi:carboxyl-terminal processing protease